jgi:hypothetical protein
MTGSLRPASLHRVQAPGIGRQIMRVLVAMMLACGLLVIGSESAQAQSATRCVTDGSISTEICFAISWTTTTRNGQVYANVPTVSGQAIRLDHSAVLVNLKLGEVVYGGCLSGCSLIDNGKLVMSQNNPVSGATYSGKSPWSNYYTQVSGDRWVCVVGQMTWAIHARVQTPYYADYCIGLNPALLSVSDMDRGLR